MGMGLLGAMGGLGQAGMDVGKQMMQAALREDELRFLEKKQMAIMQAQEGMKIAAEDRAEERRLAPVNRANDAIKSAMSADVAVAPEEVKTLSGNESEFRKGNGLLAGAYQGDPNAIVKDISRIKSDDDKRMAADALEQQLQDAKAANEAAVSGKTRKPTREEAMAAAEQSLDGDLQAQGILKAARGDKYTKVGANETILDRNGRVVFQNKQGEENLKAMFENKLEIAKATAEFKAQLGAKSGEMPSDAKMAEWLVANGVAPDMKSAYERVKQGKDKDDLAIQATIFTALNKDGLAGNPAEVWKQAGTMVSSGRAAERGDAKPAAQLPKIDTLFPVRK